jgi:DivIVA protein
MSEEPQVVSIPSGASISPDEIVRKSFPAVRKGVDGEAVRTFLAKVAAELREALQRETMLRERLVEAERRAADPELDEATLTRAIGIETAKILSTAHEAASNVVVKAQERAAELIGESERVLAEQVALAEAEAAEIRSATEEDVAEYAALAQSEADSLTDEAHADAVELLDATKEECRRMVAEARDLRNRTLADLMARRAALRVQLEELRGGKDSLLHAVDSVAAAVETLHERLASAEDQARIAAEEAGERAELQAGHDDLAELEEELANAAEVEGTALSAPVPLSGGPKAAAETTGAPPAEAGTGEASHSEPSASRRSVDELFARIRASRAAEEGAAAAQAEPVTVAEPAGQATDEARAVETAEEVTEGPPAPAGEGAPSVQEVSGEQDHTAQIPAVVLEIEETGVTKAAEADGAEPSEAVSIEPAVVETAGVHEAPVGAAALETKSAEAVALRQAAALRPDAMTEPDVESLARRDHLLGAVTAKLGRALKRALQDDQNDLLNALRQTNRKPVLDELVPPAVQRERFVAAASDQLAKAYVAGAAFLVAGDAVEGPSVSAPAPSEASASEAGTALATELAEDLSGMLRQRIEEALSELDGSMEGSADAAGVAYREWKGSRVEGLAGDFTTRAFAVGELAVLELVGNSGAPLVRWAVEDDDGGGSCPDCDDNSLAGPQLPGAAFPTGHSHPPVHPGCRCLLVPVRS